MSARQRTEKKEARRAGIGTWAKMLLYLVLGGVAGGTASVGIIRLQESGGMDGLGQLYSGMLQWAPAAQAAVFLVLFLWSLVYFRRATKEMEAPYSDEEDERADQSQAMAMLLCSTNMIVSFLLFGAGCGPGKQADDALHSAVRPVCRGLLRGAGAAGLPDQAEE